jgi:hypothetical protein
MVGTLGYAGRVPGPLTGWAVNTRLGKETGADASRPTRPPHTPDSADEVQLTPRPRPCLHTLTVAAHNALAVMAIRTRRGGHRAARTGTLPLRLRHDRSANEVRC